MSYMMLSYLHNDGYAMKTDLTTIIYQNLFFYFWRLLSKASKKNFEASGERNLSLSESNYCYEQTDESSRSNYSMNYSTQALQSTSV